MSRYIDAEKLTKEEQSLEDIGQGVMEYYAVEEIENAPTADVVPLEWIQEQMAKCTPYSIQWISIRHLLQDWERREDDK